MQVILQRVLNAHVTGWIMLLTMIILSELVSSIGQGLCVLVGISHNDTTTDMKYIVKKILNTKLFEDGDKKWKMNVMEKQFEILCISQFTLCYQFKGNKPTFHHAMEANRSKAFYADFLYELKRQYVDTKIKDGRFGAYMQVHIQNDGPVTIQIESPTVSSELRSQQNINQ